MCYLRVFNTYDVMKELLDLILPRDVLACFEVVKVCTTSARIDIYLDEKNIPPAESIAVKVFYPRVSRSRLLSRISRYVVGQFTFTFVVVNGNFHREMWLATSFPWQQMARVTRGSSRLF